MKYKLVCIDMDGTLLNRHHKVDEANKEALIKAHSMGVHIAISTGRMYTDAEYYSNLIGLKSPIIASNGALIKEKGTEEVIYKSVLDEDILLKLLDIFSKYNLKPIFHTPKKSYSGSVLYKLVMQYAKFTGLMGKNIKIEYVKHNKKWNSILSNEKNNIVKCEVIDKDEKKIKEVRSFLEKIDEIQLASSSKYNFEVTCKGVSKGSAVKALAEYYNIKQEEIIAIGDSENDMSMIKYAGMGVAMGNASEEIKKIADYITDTNDNNGVAKALYKLVI